MDTWREEALDRLPRHRTLAEEADTVSDLWLELWLEFEHAYRKDPWDETIIAEIYAFAIWCWHGSDNTGNDIDLVTAVFGNFFEKLPRDPMRRRDMPRWLCLQEFEVLQVGPFAYFLGPDERAQMVKEFREAKFQSGDRHLPRCARLHLLRPVRKQRPAPIGAGRFSM